MASVIKSETYRCQTTEGHGRQTQRLSAATVAIGTRWFRYCCGEQNLEPEATFLTLLETRYGGSVRGPFNLEARYEAGFSAEEMRALETL